MNRHDAIFHANEFQCGVYNEGECWSLAYYAKTGTVEPVRANACGPTGTFTQQDIDEAICLHIPENCDYCTLPF